MHNSKKFLDPDPAADSGTVDLDSDPHSGAVDLDPDPHSGTMDLDRDPSIQGYLFGTHRIGLVPLQSTTFLTFFVFDPRGSLLLFTIIIF